MSWVARALFVLLLLEALLRLTCLDRRLVAFTLFYQGANTPVYQVSPDPMLRYELRPGGRCEAERPHPHEGADRWTANVNRHGARGLEHPLTKGDGVYRVLALGGSTMFGHGVDDDETIPAYLERALNGRGDEVRYEVWNFGHQAWVPAQVAHLGSRELARLQPDLIVIQMFNTGRRPFLLEEGRPMADSTPYFEAEPELYLENYAAPPFLSERLHLLAMRGVASYRVVAALLKAIRGSNASPRADALGCEESERLRQRADEAGVAVVYFTIPAGDGAYPSCLDDLVGADRIVHIDQPGREPVYYEVHPPPNILEEHALDLVETLRDRDLLPRQEDARRRRPMP